MSKLRLAHVLPTLPRYHNSFKKGLYKDGNYSGLFISFNNTTGVYKHIYTDDDIPKEYFEKPWYVKSITPSYTSAHRNSASCCIMIVMNKEENDYDR